MKRPGRSDPLGPFRSDRRDPRTLRDPASRYRSAGALAEDLDRWLDGRSIIARPVSPPAQLWRWSRRNPIVAGMAALLLVLGSGLGVMIWKGESASPIAGGGIAVLPFESLVQDKANAFFADGVYDGVSTKLAKIANLKVISHNSVTKYRGMHDAPEVGRALNVAYVFEGSVRREAGKIHLDARLIDTRTGSRIWKEKYDRDLKDVFALQRDIAQKVVDRLGYEPACNDRKDDEDDRIYKPAAQLVEMLQKRHLAAARQLRRRCLAVVHLRWP